MARKNGNMGLPDFKDYLDLFAKNMEEKMENAVTKGVKAGMEEHMQQVHGPLHKKVSSLRNWQRVRDSALVGSVLAAGSSSWEKIRHLLG